MVKSGRHEKTQFKRTLALCPQCKQYMCATNAASDVNGKKYCRALPVKYCIKCNLIMVLDKEIPISYQIKPTTDEAWKQNKVYRQMRSRKSNIWLRDTRPLTIETIANS